MRYLAALIKEGPNILVSFPDGPGCQTFGRTWVEAQERAHEALEGWLETHLASGDAPPEPHTTRVTRSKAEGVWVSVSPILAVRLQLRWARQARGLSQAGLAKRIGVTRQQIALLESPDSNVTLRTLEKVAKAMHLELDIRLLKSRGAAA
jgi:predicted RNase H-like HicB family nuclease/DNA-binding XRE family transcriptional regulator